MNRLKKVIHAYNKLEEYVLVYIMVAAVLIVSLQVIMRYIFNNSLSWSEEAAKYLFVWMIWLGTSIAAKQKSHIALELVIGRLKGRTKIVMDIVVKILWLSMCIFLFVNGIEIVESMIGRGKTASAMPWLKVWVVYLAVPFSQGVLGLRLVAQLVDDVKQLLPKSKATPGIQSSLEGGSEP